MTTEELRKKNRDKMQKWRANLSEEKCLQIKLKRQEWDSKNKASVSEKRKARYQKRREIELALGREYKKKNKESVDAKVREYHKAHPELLAEINAMRRAARMKATPKWLSEAHRREIRALYGESKARGGSLWHVDHIVPLQGKTVSGLHVPWNLQLLPASENLRKKNYHAT